MGVRVNEVNSEAEKMVRGGHSQARKIKARQQQLNNKWEGREGGGLVDTQKNNDAEGQEVIITVWLMKHLLLDDVDNLP